MSTIELSITYDETWTDQEIENAIRERLAQLAEPAFNYGPEKPARKVPIVLVRNP